MAPTTPTVSQRVEELEDAVGNMEVKITEMVSKAVEKAMVVMKQLMAELLLQNQAENARKYGGELEAVVSRLEGRILMGSLQ